MPNALRFKVLAVVLALPLAGCESLTHGSLGPETSVAAALISSSGTEGGGPPGTTLTRARSLLSAGNFGLAADAYKKAVEMRPGETQGWLGLAAAYDELRRFDLADRAYMKAFQLGGPTVQLLNNRGYSYLLRGEYVAARRDLAAARSKDPGNAHIEKNLMLLQRY